MAVLSEAENDVLSQENRIRDLESRIGRQAIAIEQLQAAIDESNLNYRKLINVVSAVVSGEVSIDRVKVLPDGLSWQVLPLVTEPSTSVDTDCPTGCEDVCPGLCEPINCHNVNVSIDLGETLNESTHPRPE